MKQGPFILAILLIAVLFAGCSNNAQLEQLRQELKIYQDKSIQYEAKISELETELAKYSNITIDSVGLSEIQDDILRLREENVVLKRANDSLDSVIYGLHNPDKPPLQTHPTIPIVPIK
ncbi:hypothetical protein JXL83_09315 [candidate division WOR-3 bacterium]|nr:hypothetical protein [candidate division WOR-3 bacterium]